MTEPDWELAAASALRDAKLCERAGNKDNAHVYREEALFCVQQWQKNANGNAHRGKIKLKPKLEEVLRIRGLVD